MEIAVVLLQHMNAFDVSTALQAVDGSLCATRTGSHRLSVVSALRSVSLDHGMTLAPNALPEHPERFGLVILPGFADAGRRFSLRGHVPPAQAWVDPARAEQTRDWVVAAHSAGASVIALGSATFFLAWTGLLDGAQATTGPEFCTALAVSYPHVQVQAEVPFVHDAAHRVWTSAGGAANLALCMAVQTAEHGAPPPMHPSARSAFSALNHDQVEVASNRRQRAELRRESITSLTTCVLRSLSSPWPLRKLAQTAHLSERTLQRHFSEETGMTATEWLKRERVLASCGLLENTQLTVEQIARRVGMGNGNLLRKHFLSVLGTTPSRYRAEHQQLSDPPAGE